MVLRGVAGQIDALHAQGADQTCLLVAQLVKGVFTMVTTHPALTWREHKKSDDSEEPEPHLSLTLGCICGPNRTEIVRSSRTDATKRQRAEGVVHQHIVDRHASTRRLRNHPLYRLRDREEDVKRVQTHKLFLLTFLSEQKM